MEDNPTMDKKKRIRKYISWTCIAALVAFLAVMPLLAGSAEEADGPQASILEGTAEIRDIQTQLLGGGTLTAQEAGEITVPAAVKLTAFLVRNGDSVSEGDAIATVDRVSVMEAITQVQDTMDHLTEQIQEAADDAVSESVTAQTGGTVKIIYAAEGNSVQEVMLQHGALAVLSLDGLMAVKLERHADISAGSGVAVTLSDETKITGRVASNLDGVIIVTIPDDDYQAGELVSVATEDGDRLGAGELYIHSPWNAVAYSGMVSDIRVSEGDEISAGKTLIKLEDTGYTAQYQQLSSQRRKYEEMMLELFQMYQSTTITAPCDGVISGIDENSAQLLSAEGQSWSLSLLANSPTGEENETYVNYIGTVLAVAADGLIMSMNQQGLPVTDYANIPPEYLNTAAMTTSVIYSDGAPIYERSETGEWIQISAADIGEKDILLFTFDAESNPVWVIRVQRAEIPEEVPTEPLQPEEPAEPTMPEESTDPPVPADPSPPTVPSGGGSGITFPSDMQQAITGGMISGYGETETFEAYSMETVTVASVTGQEEMTLEIAIDELDIAGVRPGQEVSVTVDALDREVFTGVITDIGNTGTSSGGNSKFTVEITLPRSGQMLSGMNASVSIPLDTSANVLTIPVAALAEEGTRTMVYTGCDEDGNLCDPVDVTLGISDGEYVQILSGLEPGDSFCYAYYDTLDISNSVESGFSFR